MRPGSLRRLAVTAMAIPLVLACSDAGPTDPPEAPVIDTGSGVVGTKGGIVAVGSSSSPAFGTILVIPAGALAEPVEIRISAAPSSVSLPGDPTAVVVRLEPAGLRFKTAVALGLSYANKAGASPATLKIVHYDPSSGTTTDLPSVSVDAQTQTLYAATDHFSHFALTSAGGAQFGTLTDTRDGKNYRTVVIGMQTWMADNLDRRAGEFYCGDRQTANCDTYGALYKWSAARSACPSGWRLPTDADWSALSTYLGTNVGGKLKAVSGLWQCSWCSGNDGATNETGFSALPGGYRHRSGGTWELPGEKGHFWSATEDPADATAAWQRSLWVADRVLYRGLSYHKDHALSVRCLKN
ncbi:MAG: FISUMP domain-containing protein [Longimicrobiales bacterium]